MTSSGFTFRWPHTGNAAIADYLGRSIVADTVGHAYLFVGPENLGKTTFAERFAQALLCANRLSGRGPLPCGVCPACRRLADLNGSEGVAHGDCHIVKKAKDKKLIGIDEVRELIRTLTMSAFLGGAKVGIIKHADTLSEEAANALLKTLEEPRPNVTIVLIAAEESQLPATIISRCQVLRFQAVPTAAIYDYLVREHGANRDRARDCARLSAGRPALAVRLLEEDGLAERYRAQAMACLKFPESDLIVRLAAVAELLKGVSGQEAVTVARRCLTVWACIARDLVLLDCDAGDLVQHAAYSSELQRARRLLNRPLILRFARAIRSAEKALDANVAPAAVLESVAISI